MSDSMDPADWFCRHQFYPWRTDNQQIVEGHSLDVLITRRSSNGILVDWHGVDDLFRVSISRIRVISHSSKMNRNLKKKTLI